MNCAEDISISLHRTATAVADCLTLLAQIERAALDPTADDAKQSLQAIDHLGQRLADLTVWLSGLADGEAVAELRERLTLWDLRQMLAPHADDAPSQRRSADELF